VMNNQVSDQELATEAAIWIVVTAIHQPKLLAKRKDLEIYGNEDFVELCKLGCEAWGLAGVLVAAAELPKVYPPISAPVLRNLARDLRDVLRRMIRTTPSIELPRIRELEKGGQELHSEPTGGDLHVSAELQKELSLKADAYEKLADLRTKQMIPSRTQIKKLAYLWPVLYVEEKTGRAHYAKVSRLLGFVDIDKNDKQLIKGLADAKRTSSQVVDWMKTSLFYIERVSS
jgi:hypothetical protein